MRVIAGSLKGRRLEGPAPGDRSIRPTSDRAREALFSILEAEPKGAFVDLFAGCGGVGLEALSRGFAPVCCVESDPAALRLLRGNARGTPLEVRAGDVLDQGPEAFAAIQVLFGDPPYARSADLLLRLAPRLRSWLAPAGLLIWESDARMPLPAPDGFAGVDHRRYGAAAFDFLRPLP